MYSHCCGIYQQRLKILSIQPLCITFNTLNVGCGSACLVAGEKCEKGESFFSMKSKDSYKLFRQ